MQRAVGVPADRTTGGRAHQRGKLIRLVHRTLKRCTDDTSGPRRLRPTGDSICLQAHDITCSSGRNSTSSTLNDPATTGSVEASGAGSDEASTSASSPRDDLPTTFIRPPKGWQALNLPELWRYRELFLIFALRDIKVRYKQTVLGGLWALIQPIAFTVVGMVIFKGVAALLPFKLRQ